MILSSRILDASGGHLASGITGNYQSRYFFVKKLLPPVIACGSRHQVSATNRFWSINKSKKKKVINKLKKGGKMIISIKGERRSQTHILHWDAQQPLNQAKTNIDSLFGFFHLFIFFFLPRGFCYLSCLQPYHPTPLFSGCWPIK